MTFLSSLAFLSVHTHIKGGGGLQTAKMHHVKKPKEKNTACYASFCKLPSRTRPPDHLKQNSLEMHATALASTTKNHVEDYVCQPWL